MNVQDVLTIHLHTPGSNVRSWVLKLTQCTDTCDQVHNSCTYNKSHTHTHTHTHTLSM